MPRTDTTTTLSACSSTSLATSSASSDPGTEPRGADLKRARFDAKFQGKTDAEILGCYLVLCDHAYVVNVNVLLFSCAAKGVAIQGV
jgi:hypothetical protein